MSYLTRKAPTSPPLPWASFPVAFRAGQDTSIQVSYLLPLQTSVKGSELALYYIFQTGAGWAGPIGSAELILNLPYPASSETLTRMDPGNLDLPYFNSNPRANLPLDGTMEGNQVRWAWTDFEPGPQDDFSIWLVDPGMYQQLSAARAHCPGKSKRWSGMAGPGIDLPDAGDQGMELPIDICFVLSYPRHRGIPEGSRIVARTP